MALQQRVELCLIADQEKARTWVAHGGDLQALYHHERRVIAAHGVNRQRVGCGQGRREATPLPGVRREPRPSAHPRPVQPRVRRRSRNGCRRDAAASAHRNWGTRRVPRGAAPRDCDACRGGTATSCAWERPWDCAPPVLVTPCGPSEEEGRSLFINNTRGRRLAEGQAGRKGPAAKPAAAPVLRGTIAP